MGALPHVRSIGRLPWRGRPCAHVKTAPGRLLSMAQISMEQISMAQISMAQISMAQTKTPGRRWRWSTALAAAAAVMIATGGVAGGVALPAPATQLAAAPGVQAVPAKDWLHTLGNRIVDEAG